MLVDTGNFMSDERGAHGRLRPDVVARNDWVLKAYSQFGVDVANVSSHDLRYFSTILAKPELARLESEPLLDRLVSANILSESPGLASPHPFIVRDVPSRQPGSKPVQVAFIGLTETDPPPPSGLKLIDPAEAARRTIPEARKRANLVVALVKGSSEEAARIAREAPGIDVILAGNGSSLEQNFTPPYYAGQTLIVFTPFETRLLGEIRFYQTAPGKFSTRQRFIALDETSIPEDADAKKLVDASNAAQTAARKNSKSLLDDWLANNVHGSGKSPDSPIDRPALNGRSTSCNECHLAQFMKWVNSAHAHTSDSLQKRETEFEQSCLECHGSGFKAASAGNKLEPARFQNVQCEQCHGPAGEHISKPGKGYGRVANLQGVCTSCHTTETSPGFDTQAAWAKIKH